MVERLPLAQGVILETRDRVPRPAPCMEPASPSACVSASLSLSVSHELKTNKQTKKRGAKLWKEPRCPSKDEWIKKVWFMYTMEYYSAIRNDKYPPFASTWMELEGIMLSEVSQSEKDKQCMFSFIWGI